MNIALAVLNFIKSLYTRTVTGWRTRDPVIVFAENFINVLNETIKTEGILDARTQLIDLFFLQKGLGISGSYTRSWQSKPDVFGCHASINIVVTQNDVFCFAYTETINNKKTVELKLKVNVKRMDSVVGHLDCVSEFYKLEVLERAMIQFDSLLESCINCRNHSPYSTRNRI